MRFTEIELQSEDLLWFGVDIKGNILAFYSGGAGCVPEFVCSDKKATYYLQDYFLDELEINNDSNSELLAKKGLYCFDVSYEDNYGNSYHKLETPIKPINISSLPEKVMTILKNNKIECIATDINSINVKHAY